MTNSIGRRTCSEMIIEEVLASIQLKGGYIPNEEGGEIFQIMPYLSSRQREGLQNRIMELMGEIKF